jgi:hypothetical protein
MLGALRDSSRLNRILLRIRLVIEKISRVLEKTTNRIVEKVAKSKKLFD